MDFVWIIYIIQAVFTAPHNYIGKLFPSCFQTANIKKFRIRKSTPTERKAASRLCFVCNYKRKRENHILCIRVRVENCIFHEATHTTKTIKSFLSLFMWMAVAVLIALGSTHTAWGCRSLSIWLGCMKCTLFFALTTYPFDLHMSIIIVHSVYCTNELFLSSSYMRKKCKIFALNRVHFTYDSATANVRLNIVDGECCWQSFAYNNLEWYT